MYDHRKQYRCTIIRGKSKKELDDLLPAYAKVIDDICPCSQEKFEAMFNENFKKYLDENKRKKKTLDNHRTEIAGKLFGMYYHDRDGYVYTSERTKKFLSDNDQPAFFKEMCYKMQFPNGMQKNNTIQERINMEINIKPNAFILQVLKYAKAIGIEITKKDIGYYILNALDVLQGNADPLEVIRCIEEDKKNNEVREIFIPGKASSYCYQHINEQINYLELANLVTVDSQGVVNINTMEDKAIDTFIASLSEPLYFDIYSYNVGGVVNQVDLHYDWEEFYCHLSDKVNVFETTIESLGTNISVDSKTSKSQSNVAFGDEGEAYVYNYEKNRVACYNKRLANKVLSLGKQKGLGFDIQSVVAEDGEFAEFVKYIEVKSTKRITAPDPNDNMWIDTLNITRNEWVAAQQHKEFYSIFRVYFIRGDIIMYVLKNIAEKVNNGQVDIVPITYRMDFNNEAIDEII